MGKKKDKKGKKKKTKELGPTPAEIAQMEGELQAKVVEVTEEIEGLKTNIDELREENIKLHEESMSLKDDTHAYVNEMRARSERRQAVLQGIQQLKQRQLASVQQQRGEARSGHQRRRAALTQEITSRSQELALAQKQLQDLEPVRRLQQEQNAKISSLQTRLEEERSVYDTQVLEMKRQLIRLKYSLQDELQRELDEVKEQASSVAHQCLGAYVSRVREENATLRSQLKERIDENKVLEAEFRRQSHVRDEQRRERSYRGEIISRLQQRLGQ